MDVSRTGVPSLGDSENFDTKRACVFCKIVKGEIPCEKVLERDNFIVIKDVNPKVEGHLLVIPNEHYKNFLDLPSELYEDLLKTVKDVLNEKGIEDFNLAVVGELVPHFHLHVLPRREGDGFSLNC